MIRAVLFDLDGTLLNREESLKKFISWQCNVLHTHLGHVPKEKFCSRFIELDDRGYKWKDFVYKTLIQEFNIKDITEMELLNHYITNFHSYCVPFSNLLSMLDQLKKLSLSLGMISNGKGQFQMDNIVSLGIRPYFKTILISEWEDMKKPDPRIFEKALRQLNVNAEEAVYIGDHPINDIIAAKNVGLHTIWKRDIYWPDANADYTIDNLDEIPFLLNKIR
ncbi:MAG: HAD-IA family hydrolase [Psychrobacillus sp.]|uniref:HAD family hydrolase n=1 Tax=uncultured Psychrobacillus sp. TaxID=1551585 RepID=UPI002633A3F2|nr:HAD-IA family hydrolase [uncultured Psychrobacillus sp.]